MSINLGDAVFTYLADTRSLDKGQAKVNQMTKDLKSAGDPAKIFGQYMDQAGDSAEELGDKAVKAGSASRSSFHEARNSVDLLTESVGVHLPRELKNLIASSGVAQKALSAAFGAAAIVGLIGFAVDLGEKLSALISDTFIYTEAMKAQDKTLGDLNLKFVEQAAAIKESQKQLALIGLEGSVKTKKSFEVLTEEVTKNDVALRTARDTVYAYEHGLLQMTGTQEENTQTIQTARNNIVLLTGAVKEGQLQQAILSATYNEQLKAEAQSLGEARIQGEQSLNTAILAVQKARIAQSLTLFESASKQFELLESSTQERQYQIDINALKQRQALLRLDPTKNVNALASVYLQIETLEADHTAKLTTQKTAQIKADQDIANAMLNLPLVTQTVILQAGQTLDQFIINGLNQFKGLLNGPGSVLDSLQKVGQAFQQLGLKDSPFDLAGKAGQQETALRTLRQFGVSTIDLNLAEQALITTKIQLAKAEGQNTSAMEKELAGLKKQHDQLTRQNIPATKQWLAIHKDAKTEMVNGIGQAVQAWALGQSSIGQAVKSMVAQILAGWAAQDAMAALREVGYGFATMFTNPAESAGHFQAAAVLGIAAAAEGGAARAVGGAQGQPGSATNPAFTQDAGPVGTPEQTQRGNNVKRFASGGLVTGRTMAMIGDSVDQAGGDQVEAAIPLDDPRAVARIREALGGQGTTVNIKGLISGDNLHKVMKKMSREVSTGKGRLTAGATKRITRRS